MSLKTAVEPLSDAHKQLEAVSVIDPKRAIIRVDMGDFTHAVRGLRPDLAEHALTKGVVSSDQALRGLKAAMDAALGRGSQAQPSGLRT